MGFPVRIFEPNISNVLGKENLHRLERVMRLRPGDSFVITDGQGKEATALLQPEGHFTLSGWQTPSREPAIKVTLFVPPVKGERFDWLIEKAVELGVKKIVPVFCRHSVVKTISDNKLDRWHKIAVSAMLQSGGCFLPGICRPINFKDLPLPTKSDKAYVMYEKQLENGLNGFGLISSAKEVLMLSGPEGGFAENEIESLLAAGWQSVWLGKRILRAETAPIVALANIFYSNT